MASTSPDTTVTIPESWPRHAGDHFASPAKQRRLWFVIDQRQNPLIRSSGNCLEGPAMTTIQLSGDQVTQLADLLAVVAAAADTSDEDRHQLHYCRDQLRELMPPIEVLVLAGVLREVPERPGPDPAVRNRCRWWSAYLAHLLSDASAATAAAIGQHPLSSTGPAPVALRLAS
jgi:hypothetical protein